MRAVFRRVQATYFVCCWLVWDVRNRRKQIVRSRKASWAADLGDASAISENFEQARPTQHHHSPRTSDEGKPKRLNFMHLVCSTMKMSKSGQLQTTILYSHYMSLSRCSTSVPSLCENIKRLLQPHILECRAIPLRILFVGV